MPFSKTFPKTIVGSSYPRWEEVFLTKEEELVQEKLCRSTNQKMMKECISDAKDIAKESNLKDFQSDIIKIATTLFDKRASHEVFFKEAKCKDKFDAMGKK